MPRFRKKPVVINAFQICENFWETSSKWPIWIQNAMAQESHTCGALWNNLCNNDINIQTLEGRLIAKYDDWIIQGVQGEIYPCKPDIFAATYEPV